MKTKLLNKKLVAKKTMEFCFKKPGGLNFRAGQYFNLKLINPKEIDEKGNQRIFSSCSSPNATSLCFATRMRDSAFKKNLKDLEVGDEIELDGPYGQMILPRQLDKPLIFIAGGIGIAPFISMIRYKIENNLPCQIYLFYSNRRPEDAAYLNELTRYNQENKIKLITTMTQINSAKEWSGEVDYINENMIKKYVNQDLKNFIFYIAGAPQMTQTMLKVLEGLNISEEKIKYEDFAGY